MCVIQPVNTLEHPYAVSNGKIKFWKKPCCSKKVSKDLGGWLVGWLVGLLAGLGWYGMWSSHSARAA